MSGPWRTGPTRAPPHRLPPGGRWLWWLALALGVGALVSFLAWRFPDAIY